MRRWVMCCAVALCWSCVGDDMEGAAPELKTRIPVSAYVGQEVVLDASETVGRGESVSWFGFGFGDGTQEVRTTAPRAPVLHSVPTPALS